MRFVPDLDYGDIISNNEIVEIFKCGNMGGMRRSHKTNTLVLICDHTKSLYEDKWRNGIILYTGMGKEGDQVLKGNQNATLYESGTNGVQVHLFEVFDRGEYIYRGEVELANVPYREKQKDDRGLQRLVWMFPLRRVGTNTGYDGKVELTIDFDTPGAQKSIEPLVPVAAAPKVDYTKLPRCCYANSLTAFLKETRDNWLNTMKDNFLKLSDMPLGNSQINAWKDCFKVLQEELPAFVAERPDFDIIFEYVLPYESGRRPDVLLLSKEQVIIIEFKQNYRVQHSAVDQVAAYARDLKEYHVETRGKAVSPVLMLTGSSVITGTNDGVLLCSKTHLAQGLKYTLSSRTTRCDIEAWLNSKYAPLPTIVEAARMFMKKEELPNIKRVNSTCIPDAIDCLKDITAYAEQNKKHVVAMVTGVPGAGKTFLGLQYVYDICKNDGECNSVYLSGNGPLIQVLADALHSKVFVKDLHKVIQEYLKSGAKDFAYNVVVFDEGQRAWDCEQMALKRNTSKSEPEIMLELCSKRLEWCVLLVLVGEGQEIHNGENAGISQWNTALNRMEIPWEVICPDKLALTFADQKKLINPKHNALNLSMSLRSHLASDVSKFVNSFISGDITTAFSLVNGIYKAGFHMYITRSLESAKNYVQNRYANEPNKKYGLMASAKGRMLDEYGMPVSQAFFTDHAKWFNAPRNNERSCCALQWVETEFGCQGLEIDMPIIGWSKDMLWDDALNEWKKFKAKEAKDSEANTYRVNSYRVLLTRGRDGFVIFVPPAEILDGVYNLFKILGIRELPLEAVSVPKNLQPYGEQNENVSYADAAETMDSIGKKMFDKFC